MSFPKKGKIFPDSRRVESYALVVAAALHDELGETHQAIKTVIRWTGANERTVKNWFAGTCGPSGKHLLALARHSDEVFEALLVLSGRESTQAIVAKKLINLRDRLAEMHQLMQTMFGES